MVIQRKGGSKKKIIKTMVQGTLSSLISDFCITAHWHCPINHILQPSKTKLVFDGARQGGGS